MAGQDAELACGRPAELCAISRRRRICPPSIIWATCHGARTKRQRSGTRGGEVSPVVPSAARGEAGGRAGLVDLSRPGFLTPDPDRNGRVGAKSVPVFGQDHASEKATLRTSLQDRAKALGFTAIGIASPDAIPEAGNHLQSLPRRRLRMATWRGWPPIRSAAPIRASLWARCARSSCSA